MADEIPVGFVVLVTSEVRSQARLLERGRIFPSVEAAAAAITAELRTFSAAFYLFRVVELVPPRVADGMSAELRGLNLEGASR